MRASGRQRLAALLCCAFVLSALTLPSAQAHTGYYPRTWETEYRSCLILICSTRTRDVQFWTVGSWAEASKDRIESAMGQWSAVSTGRHFSFRYNGTGSLVADPCGNDFNNNVNRWTSSSDTWLAATSYCVTSSDRSKIWAAVISFNTRYRWYNGTGTPDSTRYDLWSVATHELGHVGGFSGHFDGTTLCPSNSTRHTMCSSVSPGSTYWRSLESHDRDTFQNAYR